jgi:hypothetical protein
VNLAFAAIALQNYFFQTVSVHHGFQDSINLVGFVVWRYMDTTFWASELSFSSGFG